MMKNLAEPVLKFNINLRMKGATNYGWQLYVAGLGRATSRYSIKNWSEVGSRATSRYSIKNWSEVGS